MEKCSGEATVSKWKIWSSFATVHRLSVANGTWQTESRPIYIMFHKGACQNRISDATKKLKAYVSPTSF